MKNVELGVGATFCNIAAMNWMTQRLDFVCLFFSISTVVFSIALKNSIDHNLLSFTLQSVIDLIDVFSYSIISYIEI